MKVAKSRFALSAILICLGIIWGGTVPLVKISITEGIREFALMFFETIVVSLVLGSICLIGRIKVSFAPKHLKYCLVIAMLGTVLPNTFSYIAFAQLPAGIMAIIIATVPMLTMMVGLMLKVEQFQKKRLLGVALGILSMVIIALPEAALPQAGKLMFIAVAFLASVTYAIEGNFVSLKAPEDLNPVSIILVSSLIAVPIAGLLALFTGQLETLNPDVSSQKAIIAAVVFSAGHAIAYSGFMWLITRGGPVFASQIAYVVTLSGVGFSAFFLGESYTAYVWIALLLMLVGMALVQPKEEPI